MTANGQLTPVERFDGFYVKREDLACAGNPLMPCGAKVRQYTAMVKAAPANAVVAVGCSRFSAMQIYVAAAAKQFNRAALIVVPAARQRSQATRWAMAQGAEVVEVRPGYPSQCRAILRRLAKERGLAVVRWNAKAAAQDAAAQCASRCWRPGLGWPSRNSGCNRRPNRPARRA